MMTLLMQWDRGIAMPLAVTIVAVVTLLGFSAAFLVDSEDVMTGRYVAREEALHIAEAGVNKYIWHLNKDSRYWRRDSFSADEIEPGEDMEMDRGHYRIEIVEEPTVDHPFLTIKSTGWLKSGPDVRVSVEMDLVKRGFSDNLFVTDVERTLVGQDKVWWVTGDEIFGSFHTNGQIYVNGSPQFHGTVSYSGAAPDVRNPSLDHDGDDRFLNGNPQLRPELEWPAGNTQQLKLQAKLAGYNFNGRTSIYLRGDVMDILHYDIDQGEWIEESNVPLPSNGVIYVDGGSGKLQGTSGNVFVSGELNGRLTIGAANDIYITGSDPTEPYSYTTSGGVEYADSSFDDDSEDMLGLVAERHIRILHRDWPRSASGYSSSHNNVAPHDVTIHAAMFALEYAFELEDYSSNSPKGTITFRGSLTQRYRGAVGTFSSWSGARLSGYLKDYRHDPRMSYDAPPHFLEPDNTGWEIRSWSEVGSGG